MALDDFPDRLPGADRAAVAILQTVDSTNALCRRVAEASRSAGRQLPRLVVAARRQTAGRGRRGRRWQSPPGGGDQQADVDAAGPAWLARLPLAVPVALCEALSEPTGGRCRIKWPNDLVVDGRKLGGVLIETVGGGGGAVVGFGVNCALPGGQPLADPAVALAELGAEPPVPERLAFHLAVAVLDAVDRPLDPAQLVERYRRLSAHRRGDSLRWHDGERWIAGSFDGFDDDGRLRLATAGGLRLVAAGELVEGEPAGAAR